LESTELTAISPPLINRARFVSKANVFGAFLNGPLEESFASFAGSHAVVLAGCDVTAHSTQL
jgi:hypothetical protein